MSTNKFTDEFKRDAVAQVEDRGYPVREVAGLDLSRFCSGQVLMLSGPSFEGHGAFPAQG